MESADRALDHENTPVNSWEFIKTYILSGQMSSVVSFLTSIPFLGKLFKGYIFNHFSLSYDIIVNFIEANEQAQKMIIKVISNQQFVQKILNESQKELSSAEAFMQYHIEEMFPEIAKAIQHRRAQYYLLIHEYHFVEDMLKKGQIEEKEAKELKDEIDKKIYYLKMHDPEIELLDHNQRIQFYSELSEIFDRNDLHTAIGNHKKQERMYN